MSTANIIMNILILIILGGLYLLSFKIKKKAKTRVEVLNDFQNIIDSQNLVISHFQDSLNSVSGIFRSISGNLLQLASNNEKAQDLSTAFKELSYRINEQINQDDANSYRYSLITGDCFSDTSNCLLVLDSIIKDCNTKGVHEIVQDFKIATAGVNYKFY